MSQEAILGIESEEIIAGLWKKVNANIGVLLAVPLPSGDFVFAPHPVDVKRANENLDKAITNLQGWGISITRDQVWKLAIERDALIKRL